MYYGPLGLNFVEYALRHAEKRKEAERERKAKERIERRQKWDPRKWLSFMIPAGK